jgi:hypothetical protein
MVIAIAHPPLSKSRYKTLALKEESALSPMRHRTGLAQPRLSV